jgi:hypothetical protein
MPKDYGDTVYLYFHNEGGIKWYTSRDPIFVEDVFVEDIIVDLTYIRTDFVRAYFAEYRYLSEYSTCEPYDDYFAYLKVSDSLGNPVYSGLISNANSVNLTGLPAGNYTCELYLNDGDADPLYTEVLTVTAGSETDKTFDTTILKFDNVQSYIELRYFNEPIFVERLLLEPIPSLIRDAIYLDPIYVKP